MGYSEGAHDSPADTKDRLVRIGSKYQATPPSVADGDNIYLLVDSAGRIITIGSAAHDAAAAGNPHAVGGYAVEDISAETPVAAGDISWLKVTRRGGGFIAGAGQAGDASAANPVNILSENDTETRLAVSPLILAPDNAFDRMRSAMNSGPGFGAMNAALIGGDVTLRASAVAGEASGTSTAVADLGWVKSFHGVLDVTAVPSGGTPTLDVFIQTQMANNDWQDLAHFTQVAGATTKELMAWGPPDGNIAGIGAEGSAATFDRFFTNEDAALAAAAVRLLPLGDSMRVKWVFSAGGSTGDYTFSVDISAHS